MSLVCRYRIAIAALLVVVAAGCKRDSAKAERDLDQPALAAALAIDRARMHVRTDRVGHGQWESEASFVLVDVESRHDADLLVTLGGALIDDDGRELGPLRSASLRIPAGGVRTFALVDKAQQAYAGVSDARIDVQGAFVPSYSPPVVVSDGHVYRDGDRVVVTARIHNTAEAAVRALILAGFYDRADTPMTRPFTEMYIPGKSDHTAEFVGPEGSVKGYIFVGDVAY